MEWGNRPVRQLLRKLRTPGAIQEDELARTLRRLTGAPSVRDAVLMLTNRALNGYPPVYATIVRRVDVDGESSQAVAAEIHLSQRSFFRYRAAAVAAVAAEIDTVTRGAPRRPREDLDVLALVARGRYLWQHRAGVADVHLLMGEYLIRDPLEAFHDAHVAVEQAMAIDPSLPELHATLADLHLFGR